MWTGDIVFYKNIYFTLYLVVLSHPKNDNARELGNQYKTILKKPTHSSSSPLRLDRLELPLLVRVVRIARHQRHLVRLRMHRNAALLHAMQQRERCLVVLPRSVDGAQTAEGELDAWCERGKRILIDSQFLDVFKD